MAWFMAGLHLNTVCFEPFGPIDLNTKYESISLNDTRLLLLDDHSSIRG